MSATAQSTNTFKNPLLDKGPDPWVYKHTDKYYYSMVTTGDRLEIIKTKTISEIKNATPVIVWRPPVSGPNSKNIWAPEIHHLDNKWYIYYTASNAANEGDHTRHVFVLENSSPDPLKGIWIDKGAVNTKFTGLDGSVFEHNGKRYFLYSAYVGNQSVLFICEMINPWTVTEKQVMIARPTYAWESFKERSILEGPQFLKGSKDKLFIVYSASACWDDNYALGMLAASSKANLMDSTSWIKSSDPVFKSSDENSVYGPGHNSFTKSPDGKEDWIIYHAKNKPNGECSGRSMRAQKFTWNNYGYPNFGIPIQIDKKQPLPASD